MIPHTLAPNSVISYSIKFFGKGFGEDLFLKKGLPRLTPLPTKGNHHAVGI